MLTGWSIGIYSGSSPLQLAPAPGVDNPVLTAADVDDIDAEFVADPFMVRSGRGWVMFFEVLERGSQLGRIGAATSDDLLRWRYRGIVLSEPFHLSYPLVFEHGGDYYMIPETLALDGVHLYRAESFPERWTRVAELIPGMAADPTIVLHAGRWWLFSCPRAYAHDCLRIHFADDPRGPWIEHPASPVIDGARDIARPAGRPVAVDGALIRYAQDCSEIYGKAVRAARILELSPTTYIEEPIESPVLGPGPGWTRAGMHHVDLHELEPGRWIGCVDGRGHS